MAPKENIGQGSQPLYGKMVSGVLLMFEELSPFVFTRKDANASATQNNLL
jgi:hypothetical protein